MMQLFPSSTFHVEPKLLRTLQQCKQIPKDDRLIIRKMVSEGNQELVNILQDNQNKKIQIKLRKFLQRQKENKKLAQADKLQIFVIQRCRSKGQQRGRAQKMVESLKQFQKTVDLKKSKTQANSLKNSVIYQKKESGLKTGQETILHQKLQPNIYTQICTEQQNIFTPVGFLEQLRRLPLTKSYKNIDINPPSLAETSNFANFDSFRKFSSVSNLRQTSEPQQCREQALKNILISQYAEDIFLSICNKHFPVSLNCQSVYLPYRRLLEQIQEHANPVQKNNTFNTDRQYLDQSQSTEFLFCVTQNTDKKFIKGNQIPILAPFDSQFEAVTIEKLGEFLNRYCLKRSNQIHNMFIILGSQRQFGNDQGISHQRFAKINLWRGPQLVSQFKQIVDKWGINGKISYWRMYRVQSQGQIKQFLFKYSQRL